MGIVIAVAVAFVAGACSGLLWGSKIADRTVAKVMAEKAELKTKINFIATLSHAEFLEWKERMAAIKKAL